MRIVIAHCWTGTPGAGWYPAAADALRQMGHGVCVPSLPDTDSPQPADWLVALDEAIGNPDGNLLLVGHSLGALAMLHWLARAPSSTRIAGMYLVAPPLSPTGIAEVDRFLDPAPDLAAIAGKARRSAVLVSDADRYLRPDPATVAQRLVPFGFEVQFAPGKGHFSPASGLRSLPQLAAWVATFADVGDRSVARI